MGWVLLGCFALLVLLGLWRRARYWLWVRSIKDPGERMAAEITYKSWRRSKKRG